MKSSETTSARTPRVANKWLSAAVAMVLLPMANAQNMPEPNILQTRGVDQQVDYTSLTKFGKWDDRNYELTKEDLSYLSADEDKLGNQIPAFFRVELRKAWPHLQKSGPAQYPRAAWQMFRMKYGGFLRDGKTYGPKWGVDRLAQFRADNELQLNQVLGANELTVEINHANPDRVIAGSNNNGGQEMYYSADGGQSWTIQGTLPNTCCDPTVGWSPDGTVAYAAALSGPIGVSFWRSFDQGETWVDRFDLTPNGSDKEWLHVDISGSSPHSGNVYLTWHDGNTMQFARSTDQGTNFDITSFPGAPRGIGSDITTTTNGDIYYFWGATGDSTVEMLKSTDGGASFAPAFTVASTNASFDWPVPSMESRRAWIYASADSDRSGGAFDGSVYVAFADTLGPESTAVNNHTVVNVYYSRDGGATWSMSNPHPVDDTDDVDRYNPWMTVDEFGTVHTVFYDTRNSLNRTGVDLYYAFSTDGAVTWSEPERVSSATSANLTDGQEWGDYNGISVVGEKIVTVWTDNRDGPPNQKDGFAATLVNAGASPSFLLGAAGADTLSQEVCAPGDLTDIDIAVGQIQGFDSPVSLSYTGLPAGFSGGFSVNPVVPATPAATSTASITVGGASAGSYNFSVTGTAAGVDPKNVGVNVDVFTGTPAAAALSAPADGATDTSTSPIFTWGAVAQAASYTLEVDDDPAFGSIDFTTTTGATSATITGSLSSETTYYWRVTASNPCGGGATSAASSFTTAAEICVSPNLAIPDGTPAGTSDSAAVSATGTIENLDVSIVASHTYVGDLIFTLTHDDTGTSVVLMDRPGVPASTFGCSSDNIDATMTDSSSTAVETTCGSAPALGGLLQPQEPLAAFIGEDLGGTWTLSVSDNAGVDTGVLEEWCLLPQTAGGPDSDGDGVEDAADNCTLVPNADQRDTNGDGFGNACDADLNNDGVINVADLGLLRAVFFTADADADLNGDGVVNVADLGILRASFFGAPGPSGVAN
ncbi:MAG: proprotein convertase P-domain-containing protein [Gammaproteobacteria bacterium]